MKKFWKPLTVAAMLALMTFLLIAEDYSHNLHATVLQIFMFMVFILAIWYRKWLFPAVAYFVVVHITLDAVASGAFPADALRDSFFQTLVANFLYFVLNQRDHSRGRLANYIDASRIGTWEWNLKKDVMTYNERWAQMLGYTLSELHPITKDTWKSLAHPDDAAASDAMVAKVVAREIEYYDLIARLRHKDGHWVWIHDRGKVIEWSKQGEPLLMSGTHTDISKEQELAEELFIRNEKFVRLVESTPDIIYELDLDQKYTSIYGKWLKNQRLKPSYFIGKTARDLFGAEDALIHENAFQGILRGESVVYEWPSRIPTGTVWYQTSLSPILGPSGAIVGAVGVGRDVTAVKQAEQEIRHSHKLMQYIIEHSNSAIAVHDRDLRYLYVSDSYLNQYRVKDRNIIGKAHYDVFPDLPQKWRDVHQRCLKGEIIQGDRDPYPKADGTVEYTRWECRPWFEDDGAIGGIIVYTEVITAQVRMERELAKKADELFIQKQRAEATLLSIGDGVVSTDREGRIVAFNNVAARLTGWTAAEAIGRPFGDVFTLRREGSEIPVESPVAKVMRHGTKVELENHTILVSRDGGRYYIEDSAAPVITAGGELTGVVLVFRDVTEKNFKQREIEYLSIHDFMTGLYNRRHFVERMAEMDTPSHYPLGVVMTDYNGLKILNDAFGHDLGDQALKRIAEILGKNYRRSDVIARIGGDEFAVLLPNTEADVIIALNDRLRQAVARESVQNVQLSLAIGYATKTDAMVSIDEVLKEAEDDMYSRKISEGSSVRNRAIQAILETLTDKYAKEKIHSERVSRICGAIGRALALRPDDLRELEMAGLYHDIGKIAIPDSILNKPGKLTPEEFNVMKKHTEVGYQILRAADEYSDLAEYALSHQERWDGTGYPRGLREKDIPLFSRIISVADAYEAMTSDRPYRKAMSKADALTQMRLCRGTQFDPELTDVFLAAVIPNEDL